MSPGDIVICNNCRGNPLCTSIIIEKYTYTDNLQAWFVTPIKRVYSLKCGFGFKAEIDRCCVREIALRVVTDIGELLEL